MLLKRKESGVFMHFLYDVTSFWFRIQYYTHFGRPFHPVYVFLDEKVHPVKEMHIFRLLYNKLHDLYRHEVGQKECLNPPWTLESALYLIYYRSPCWTKNTVIRNTFSLLCLIIANIFGTEYTVNVSRCLMLANTASLPSASPSPLNDGACERNRLAIHLDILRDFLVNRNSNLQYHEGLIFGTWHSLMFRELPPQPRRQLVWWGLVVSYLDASYLNFDGNTDHGRNN